MIKACPNKSHPDWKTLVTNFGEDGAYALYIKNGEEIPHLSKVPTLVSQDNNNKEQILSSLNGKIQNILTQAGISIGVLTEFEKQFSSGVFDTQDYINNAKGLVEIVRIAEGKEGTKALPEEFGHVVMASLKDNPLYTRLYNILNDDILRTIFEVDEVGSYEKYKELYNNEDTLKEEALGKLFTRHLLNNEGIPQEPYKNLLERIKNLFKEIWSRISSEKFEADLNSLDVTMSKVANEVMNGTITIDVKNVINNSNNQKLYKLNNKLQRNREINKKIIEVEQKRLKIFELNKKPSDALKELIQEKDDQITQVEMLYSVDKYDDSIAMAMSNILEDMIEFKRSIDNISSQIGNKLLPSNFNQLAQILRDTKTYIDAYSPIVKEVKSYYRELQKEDSTRFSEQNRFIASELSDIMEEIEENYTSNTKKLFINFLRPYFGGETVDINFGRNKRSLTLEQLVNEAETDIGGFDRWLNSMSDSSDMLLRVIEQPVKLAQHNKRDKVLEYKRQLQEAQLALEESGIKDTSFIYKRNDKGELTGYMIQEIDWVKYNKARREKIKELNDKYGDRVNSTPINRIAWNKEYSMWLLDNNIDNKDGTYSPKISIYRDEQYSSMNNAQKSFYDKVIKIKSELDELLPDYKVSKFLAPQVRKDFVERIKDSSSWKEAKENISEWWNEKWLIKEDDTEFGNSRGIADFSNREVMSLPIFYTKKLEKMDNLSEDIISSMILYADMAINYNEMGKIIDMLEIGRDVIRNREIGQEKNNKPLLEKFTRKGRTITNKILKNEGENNILQKLNDFFEAQVYGRWSSDSGTIFGTNISKDKAANNLNMITSLSTMALSPLTAVANVMTGKVMMRIEAVAGEFFNYKDLAWADKTYAEGIPGLIADNNRRTIQSKLGLFVEKFNVMQDYEKDIREVEMNRKNILTRNANTGSLYFMMKGGESYMQTRTALSLASSMKVKLNGKEIKLYDAYEVQVGKNGVNRLKLKEGVTKLDGTPFTSKDEFAFSNKAKAINQRMHGIYNKEDRNAIQRVWWGRLTFMFRKWMIPSINRRFAKADYNYDLQAFTEGYYNTFSQFLMNLWKELKQGKFNITANWKLLNDTQKSNIIRSLTEIGNFACILLATFLLEKLWDDDDREESWLKNFALYQLNRQITEIGVFVPSGYFQVKEGLTLLKSPMAGVKVIDDVMDLFNVINWFDEIQRGRWKGSYKITRDFMDLVPMNNTIYRGLHPIEALKFYNLN